MSVDLTGVTFGRLTVLEPAPNLRHKSWVCACSCGGKTVVRASHLMTGDTRSCWCSRYSRECRETHGHAESAKGPASRTYAVWSAMKNRCLRTKHPHWADYGGRGITYDPSWEKFENFLADMGEAPLGLTLDRIDNNGNYGKANCRWATHKEQNRNRRGLRLITIEGKTQPLSAWCEDRGLPYHRVYMRLKAGRTPEEALTI